MARPVCLRVLALLLLAACGSTVQAGQIPVESGTAPAAVALDDGLGLPASEGAPAGTAPGGTAPVPGQDPVAPAPGQAPSGGSAAPAPGAPAQPGPGGAGPGTPSGEAPPAASGPADFAAGAPGVTADTVTIGIDYSGDASARANSALGAEGVTSGDARRNNQALLDYYNERGGIAGRKIKALYYEFDTNSSFDEQEQQSCAYYTQDNEVFAVFAFDPGELYLRCLTEAGVGIVTAIGMNPADDATYATFPSYVDSASLSLSAAARVYGPALNTTGYFEQEGPLPVKIGVVTWDDGRFRRALADELKPGLASVGQEVAEERFIRYAARNVSAVGESGAQIANAVLRFNQQNVNHVLFLDQNALLAFLFMRQAENQGYRPQYGLTSLSGGQALTGLVPPEQLATAHAVGWLPLFDQLARDVRAWPAYKRCMKIYDEAGITFGDDNAKALGVLACDNMAIFVESLQAAPSPLSPASIAVGAERLGTSYQSPFVGRTTFGRGRHYGVTRWRPYTFDADCTCYRTAGGWQSI